MELKHQNLIFTSLEFALLKKMSRCETECKKKCAIGETECDEILSLYLRKTENLSEEKEGMGERKKRED